jgi:tRNA-specific 2-thiouridylase
MSRQKVTVALSGGKDSTASIVLLKKKYDVLAVTMKLGITGEDEKMEKIKKLARVLDTPLEIVDLAETFKNTIIEYFVNSYKQGFTPNPCALCNRIIKFKILREFVFEEMGADFYATGHYADKIKIGGDYFLREPADLKKSQIYFLSLLGGDQMGNIIFPLARKKMTAVKNLVKDLPLASIKESQDVCFLQNQNLMEYLRQFIPEAFRTGDILDVNNNKIGSHQGAIYFTIGQRRGTHFSSDKKLYVIDKNVKNNTITLGEKNHLLENRIEVKEPVFWRPLKKGEVLNVRVRYLSEAVPAEIVEVSDRGIQARFQRPKESITPGQIGVFYDRDIIVAAGHII